MTEYKIIEGNDWSFSNLIRRINEDCEEGWEPQGGLAITQSRTGLTRYFQAMVREAPQIVPRVVLDEDRPIAGKLP